MKKAIVGFLVFIGMFSINPPGIDAQEKIKYIGSSTVGVFVKEAAKVYKAAVFNINTKPESRGGEIAAAHAMTDIGGVAREVKSEILERGVKKFLIGKDAIGVWVNADNRVTALSTEALIGIFTGKITNWKDVGGSDMAITVYIVNPQSATRKVFQEKVLDGRKYEGERIRTIRPDPAILDRLGEDKGGIGQLSFALAVAHPSENRVRRIKIDGQPASVENSDYPITRPLYLVTKGEPTGASKAFIEWAISPEGQAIVKKFFVGIR